MLMNSSVGTEGGGGSSDTALELAYAIAKAADDRKGSDIAILQVGEVSYLADYFVVITGFSAVQVRAIARTIEDELEQTWHRRPLRTEGQGEGSWIVQDFGEVIAHIFLPREREFYNLEAFWGHAQRIDYVPPNSASNVQS
ncbi:MAG: ribosome silencing factor [Cyanobacteria bacterium Co-bin8]|nr:ribosome silencing factor [Cyanobacteria bacterium Co-bin8]